MEKPMGTALQTLSTSLSLRQRSENAKLVLATRAQPSYALMAARRLIGSWPNARPPEPETYTAAISAALCAYPQGVIDECCDPRIGLARKREFPPTVASVVEWCDDRLEYYQVLANYEAKAREVEREFTDEDRAQAKKFLREKARNPASPFAAALSPELAAKLNPAHGDA